MQLHQRRTEIESNHAKLILIGNGKPFFIEGFKELTGYTGVIYTDPSRKVFDAVGLTRGVLSTVGPRSIWSGVKSIRSGRRQGSVQGDPWQQGGALVVSTDGEVLWSHRSMAGGDNVAADALIAALP